ncbi:MAG: hypothetical protein CME57_01895 [Halieaceae bacterium]|nr:hypothetical protein [Halieaceae bacterium]
MKPNAAPRNLFLTLVTRLGFLRVNAARMLPMTLLGPVSKGTIFAVSIALVLLHPQGCLIEHG